MTERLRSMVATDISRHTLFIKIASRFVITVNGTVVSLIAGDGRPRPPIRTRIYKSKYANPSRLVFHVHGGGLVGMSPEGHENYMLEYARQITNSVILSVDYRLAPEHRFPAALQDVLDTYLWTSSENAPISWASSLKK